MRILDWHTLDRPGRRAALARPGIRNAADITQAAREIIDGVRDDGDEAVKRFTWQFDRVRLNRLSVCREEFDAASDTANPQHITALKRAIANIRRFHQVQVPSPQSVETEPGVRCELITRPIGTVGLYVPCGSAPLPSALLMLAIPAQIAGCSQRILCTPPGPDGNAHPAILTAARLCGIDTVFKIGGAQAIAAMAYGTQRIPKVDKIFGPGNAWVTAAKQLVSQDPAGAACDLPAGPSEVLVIADNAARADFVAADLLAQAEHDPLSQAILVTDSASLAQEVAQELQTQRAALSRREILAASLASCRCIVVPDLETALQVSNEYAPEHLILQVRDPRRWLAYVRSAGSVFLGKWSPEPMGDYCSGTNHVLPTYGHARAFSGLSVQDFVRRISVQELSAEALYALGPTAVQLAGIEGLDGHAAAVNRRLAALRRFDVTAPDPSLGAKVIA